MRPGAWSSHCSGTRCRRNIRLLILSIALRDQGPFLIFYCIVLLPFWVISFGGGSWSVLRITVVHLFSSGHSLIGLCAITRSLPIVFLDDPEPCFLGLKLVNNIKKLVVDHALVEGLAINRALVPEGIDTAGAKSMGAGQNHRSPRLGVELEAAALARLDDTFFSGFRGCYLRVGNDTPHGIMNIYTDQLC